MKLLTVAVLICLTACQQKPAQLQQPNLSLEPLENKAIAELQSGQLDEAFKKLDQILSEDPKRWRALNARAIAYSLREQFDDANQAYAAAHMLKLDSVAIANNWGLNLAMQGNYDEAIAKLAKAVELAAPEKRQQSELNLALVYALSGNEGPAEVILRRHLSQEQAEKNMEYYQSVRKSRSETKKTLKEALGAGGEADAPAEETPDNVIKL